MTGLGQYWPKYLPFAMYSYNIICSPNINVFNPYELGLGRKAKELIDLETDVKIRQPESFKQYYELLTKRLEHLQKLLFDLKSRNFLNQERKRYKRKRERKEGRIELNSEKKMEDIEFMTTTLATLHCTFILVFN